MTNSSYIRSSLAQAALERVPPLIRETLIYDRDFCKEYGFSTDALIAYGNTGIFIQRSQFFDAIRAVLAGKSEMLVTDSDGHDWKVTAENIKVGQQQILISRETKRYNLPDFSALSPDRAIRLNSLERDASEVNLPMAARVAWRIILSERGLHDNEFDQLHNEFLDTPVRIAQSIRNVIQNGLSSLQSLVPPSKRYYMRLVGKYDESASIGDYAVGGGKKFFEGLSAWQPEEGFLFSLFLSSHSKLTAEISVEHLENVNIVSAFELLIERGDRLSQLGAVEVGLRILPKRPEIEPLLLHLVQEILEDDVDGPSSGFKLFSALFILVDGEISKTRIFSDVPPYYRRLASLAQAALIQREIMAASIEVNKFCERVMYIYGEQFLFQSLTDMRLEPRWDPEFAAASQIKADFVGRLMVAGKKYEKHITLTELRELLVGSKSVNFQTHKDFFRIYFPGPLEGHETCPNALPDELAEAVENQLGADEIGPSSFVALVNSALTFRVEQSQAKMAAEALKMGKHRLKNIKDRSQLLDILHGLATVAAVSRGQALADEIRILVRRYRRDTQYALSIDEALRVCLIASASRYDIKDWRECVGDWLTELAFEEFQDTEGASFYSHLRCLCHVVPELWLACGRAEAALAAYTNQ